MPLYPLKYPPGVVKTNSPYTAQGRYTDMDHCRFVAGYPEKIGGSSFYDGSNLGINPIMGFLTWVDPEYDSGYLSQGSIGGNSDHLYLYNNNGSGFDETPLRFTTSSTISNPFDTTSGDATVNVNHTAHGVATGEYVQLVAGAAVGGLTIEGIYEATVTGVDDYTIEASSNATSTVSGGGGTTTYSYYHTILGADPLATTSGSANVVVTHTAHGALTGDYVTISGASVVAGMTISGEYQITKLTADTYRITDNTVANATTTGGGSAVKARYNISFIVADYSTYLFWAIYKYGRQVLVSPSALNAERPALSSSIYVYDPTNFNGGFSRFPILYNAPTSINWMFVTPERFVFALGTTTPMTVQWPDQDDYTNWTPAAGNTANSRTLQEGSKLMGGIPVRDGVSLVFSDTAVYQFNYRGDEFVYESVLAAANCGLIGPLAVNTLNGAAYWMSENDFWMWDGAVRRLPSDDIHAYVFDDIRDNVPIRQSAVCGVNSRDNEIWFFYASLATGAIYNDRYVIYHIDQNCWSIGTANITSYVENNNPPDPPIIAAASNGGIYYMETGTTIQSGVASDTATVTFAPTEISNGDVSMDVLGFIPDFKRQTGNVTLTITAQEYPQGAIGTAGTFTLGTAATRQDTRLSGRLIGGKIEAAAAGDFRVGTHRIEAQPGSGRR